MRTDPLAYIGLCLLAWFLYLAFGITASWSQQTPLEYDLDGMQEQANKNNFDILSSGNATIGSATIANATWTAGFVLQGFAHALVGGASGNVLAIDDQNRVIPGDLFSLQEWAEAPAFSVVAATAMPINATSTQGVLYLAGSGGFVVDGDPAQGYLLLSDYGTPGNRNAFSIVAVTTTIASATNYASLLTISANSTIGLDLDTADRTLTIKALGPSSRMVVVAATDSYKITSTDYIADGTSDQEQVSMAWSVLSPVQGIDIGGWLYMKEGNFAFQGTPNTSNSKNVWLRGAGWGTKIHRFFSGENLFNVYVYKGSFEFSDLYCDAHEEEYPYYTRVIKGLSLDLGSTGSQYRSAYVHDLGLEECGLAITSGWNPAFVTRVYTNDAGNDSAYVYTAITNSGLSAMYNVITKWSDKHGISHGVGSLFGSISYKSGYWTDIYSQMFGPYGAGFSGLGYDTALLGNVSAYDRCYGILGYPAVGNLVFQPYYSAINESSYGMAVGNYIADATGTGIRVYTDIDYALLANNLIKDTSSHAIFSYNGTDGDYFCSNLITRPDQRGIYINAPGTAMAVHGNYIAEASTQAIYSSAASPRMSILNNVVWKPGTSGNYDAVTANAAVTTHGVRVADNIIYDDAGTGDAIELTNGKYVTVEGNYIRGSFSATPIHSSLGHREVAQMVPPFPSSVYVLESSPAAVVALALRNEATAILTVGSGASTNPIATDWALRSDPAAKENILPWNSHPEGMETMRRLRECEITFDWRHKKGNQEEKGWDIANPSFPEHLKVRDVHGRAVGINQSQLLADLYAAADYLTAETSRLKAELAAARKGR